MDSKQRRILREYVEQSITELRLNKLGRQISKGISSYIEDMKGSMDRSLLKFFTGEEVDIVRKKPSGSRSSRDDGQKEASKGPKDLFYELSNWLRKIEKTRGKPLPFDIKEKVFMAAKQDYVEQMKSLDEEGAIKTVMQNIARKYAGLEKKS